MMFGAQSCPIALVSGVLLATAAKSDVLGLAFARCSTESSSVMFFGMQGCKGNATKKNNGCLLLLGDHPIQRDLISF